MSRGVTAAEAAAGSLVAALTTATVGAYLLDLAGAFIAPIPLLILSFVSGGVALYWWLPLRSRERSAFSDLALFAATVAAVFLALMWLAWPELLPIGGGSDMTHHLQLVDFIDRHWRLAHTSAEAALVGNMVNYTPGFHLLTSLAGAWFRTDGLHMVHPLLAASVAIKAGLLFLVARRMLRSPGDERPDGAPSDLSAAIALASVVIVFLPDDYLIGSFARFSFFSQVLSEMFAVTMWLAAVMWRDRPSAAAATMFGIAGAGAFLSWPVWIGSPVLVLGVLLATARELPLTRRLQHAALALLPIAVVALLHASGRVESVAIVQSGGTAFQPEIARFGWPFVVLASAGVVLSFVDRRARVTALLLLAVALQTAALFMVARMGHADSPYLALKMPHFAIYPLAVVGALTLDWVLRAVRTTLPSGWRASVLVPALVWMVVFGAGVVVAKRFVTVRRPAPAITENLFRAGQFARLHLQPDCIEYLVPQDSTSYWLYLAVLGNPSHPPSGTLPSIFIYREALVRWITATSYPVTIADLSIVPREVRDESDVLAQFGQIMVGRRRGTNGCPR